MKKIAIIGDSGVGKSELVKAYVNPAYQFEKGSKDSTVGAQPYAKDEWEIWDTSGQERYIDMLPIYRDKASVIIFAYDISDENSLSYIEKQIKAAKEENPDRSMILVGCKKDLQDDKSISTKKVSVSTVKATVFAENHDIERGGETTATDRTTILDFFAEVKKIIESKEKREKEIADSLKKKYEKHSSAALTPMKPLSKEEKKLEKRKKNIRMELKQQVSCCLVEKDQKRATRDDLKENLQELFIPISSSRKGFKHCFTKGALVADEILKQVNGSDPNFEEIKILLEQYKDEIESGTFYVSGKKRPLGKYGQTIARIEIALEIFKNFAETSFQAEKVGCARSKVTHRWG